MGRDMSAVQRHTPSTQEKKKKKKQYRLPALETVTGTVDMDVLFSTDL